MWRSIAKSKIEYPGQWVSTLKERWLRDNGFKNLVGDCFFCAAAAAANTCDLCPGRLVDLSFSCSNENYSYAQKPVAFYKELLRLNRIRKERK